MLATSLKQPKYFMDDPIETKRLDTKLNADEFIDTFLAQYIPIDTQTTVVDVGCGVGDIASSFAKRFTGASVKGVDISYERLSGARKKCSLLNNTEFIQGNIYNLPFADTSVEFLYSRFLLQYLKEPLKGVKEMYRVCRRDGMVMLQDLDGELMFHYPKTINNLDKVLNGLAETGYDPLVGRKLMYYGLQVGFELVHVDIRPYHYIVGKIDEQSDHLWDVKIDIALPQLEKILGSEENALKFKEDFMAYLRDEETIMYSNLITVYLKKTYH